MRHFIVTLEVTRGDGLPLDKFFFDEVEQIAEELAKLEGVQDPFAGADLGTRLVTIGLNVPEPDALIAAQAILGLVRTAIHTVGGATPGWEDDDWRLLHVENSEDSDLVEA